MTKREREELDHLYRGLEITGFRRDEIASLRRISHTLRSWAESECGSYDSSIERDETTGKAYRRVQRRRLDGTWMDRRYQIPDLEAGALRRLAAIMANHPALASYHQGDPRGAALYILRPGDVPDGGEVDSYYTRGICVW
jgi:hypothetical protein